MVVPNFPAIIPARQAYVDAGCDNVKWYWDWPAADIPKGKDTPAGRRKFHEGEINNLTTAKTKDSAAFANCCKCVKKVDGNGDPVLDADGNQVEEISGVDYN